MSNITNLLFNPVGKVFKLGENTIDDFMRFLGQQNIISLAIATAIGLYINSFITDLMDAIGVPIINKILGKRNNLKDEYECNVFGIEFELGKVFEIILRLVITLIIIYLIFSKIPTFVGSFAPTAATTTAAVVATTPSTT